MNETNYTKPPQKSIFNLVVELESRLSEIIDGNDQFCLAVRTVRLALRNLKTYL